MNQVSAVHIFVINLPDRTDRREYIESHLRQRGLDSFQFFPAVDGREKAPADFPLYRPKRRRREFGRDMTGGEMACLYSHRAIYAHMVEKGIGQALILEDDVALAENFATALKALCALDPMPDLIRFLGSEKVQASRSKCLRKLPAGLELHLLHPLSGGGHAYLLTLGGARKLLNYIDRKGVAYPVDTILGMRWETGLPNIITKPGLAVHGDLKHKSDIGMGRFDKESRALSSLWGRPLFKIRQGILKQGSFVKKAL